MILDSLPNLSAFAESLCLALAHSLWQGAVWCILLAMLLRGVPTSRTNLRYAISLGCFLGLAIGVCVTLSILRLPQFVSPSPDSLAAVADQSLKSHEATIHVTPNEQLASVNTTLVDRSTGELEQGFRPIAPWLALVWALGAVGYMFKSLGSWQSAQRLAQGRPINDSRVLELLASLKQRLGITRFVSLVESSSASGPFVVGILQPMIVIPASLVSGLTPDQWTMILGHELAHIRRYDYLVNLFQLLIEALLFFNPAVWWLSRQVRIEREACCDAWGARLGSSPLSYATALMEIGERLSPTLMPAFAARDSGSLLDRITRIVGAPIPNHLRFRWPMAAALLLVGLVIVVLIQRGSDFAVTVAAQVLSDEERVSELSKVAQEVSPTANPSSVKVLAGSIETVDGEPLPRTIHVTSVLKSDSMTSMNSQNPIERSKSNTFQYELGPGSAWLLFQSDEYATAVVGPFNDLPNQKLEPIVVKLKPGISTKVRVIDEDNNPVYSANVTVMTEIGDVATGHHLVQHLSSSDGMLMLDHIDPEQSIRLSINAPGFQQKSVADLKLKADQVTEIQLNRAQLTSGRVVDAAGQGVSGAEFIELRKRSPGSTHIEGWVRTAQAVSDERGDFKLDALLDGQTYDFVVLHPEHGVVFVRDVATGKQGIEVRMPSAIAIAASIKGSEDQLARLAKSYIAFAFKPDESEKYKSDPLEVQWPGRDLQVGGSMTEYQLKSLANGTLTLNFGSEKISHRIAPGQSEVTFQLSDVPEPSRRAVRIAFTSDGKNVSPSGKLNVTLLSTKSNDWSETSTVNVVDGFATLSVRTPCTLAANAESLIGFAPADDSLNTSVAEGTDEFQISIPVIPAGAVKGRLLRPDGTPATDCSVSVNAKFKKRKGLISSESTIGLNNKTNSRGEFFITPIPFGAQCELSASDGKNVELGESFTIDQQHAMGDFTLQFTNPVAASIHVTDERGNSLRGIPVSIALEHPRKSISWSPPEITDPQGNVTLAAINPKIVSSYRAKVEPLKDYQVTSVELSSSGKTEIRLMPGYVIEGQLVDASNRPLAGQEMWAVKKERYERFAAEARTDDQGRFRFSNLNDGEFMLQASGFVIGDGSHKSQAASTAKPITVHIK